jgi:hypothetical protein
MQSTVELESETKQSREPRRKRPRWFALTAAVLFIAALEGLFTYLDYRSRDARTHVVAWGKRRAISLEEARPGRVIRWVPSGEFLDYSDGYLEKRGYLYEADADGFLMPLAVHKDPDVSIIFQGGSTTEIVFVDPKLRFAYLAGRMIESQTGKKVNSYNAGVSGSYTLDSINSLINKLAAYHPNFVVMMEAINDLNTLLYNHNTYYGKVRNPLISIEQKRGRRPKSVVGSLGLLGDAILSKTIPHLYGRASGLVLAATGRQEETDEFAAVRGEQRNIDLDLIRANFRRNVTLYVRTARLLGATPVLMTQASRFYDDSPDWRAHIKSTIEKKTKLPFETYRELHHSLNGIIREVGGTENVLVIDLEKRIPSRSEFIHDAVHFNNNGSRLAAQIISQEFVAHFFAH